MNISKPPEGDESVTPFTLVIERRQSDVSRIEVCQLAYKRVQQLRDRLGVYFGSEHAVIIACDELENVLLAERYV